MCQFQKKILFLREFSVTEDGLVAEIGLTLQFFFGKLFTPHIARRNVFFYERICIQYRSCQVLSPLALAVEILQHLTLNIEQQLYISPILFSSRFDKILLGERQYKVP